MMISPHFSWAEVDGSPTATRLRIDNSVPAAMTANVKLTASHMEQVRTLLEPGAIIVSSWFRCPGLNAAIGGARTSAHMRGLAVDFHHAVLTLDQVFERIGASRLIPFDQLIIERTRDGARWIHLGFTLGIPRRDLLRADGANLGGPMAYQRVAVG